MKQRIVTFEWNCSICDLTKEIIRCKENGERAVISLVSDDAMNVAAIVIYEQDGGAE